MRNRVCNILGTDCSGGFARRVSPSFIFTGPPGDHGTLHHPRNASATTLRFISLPSRGVLQWLEEQSGSGCGESGSFAGQSQHQRLQHRSSPGSFVTVFARLPHRLCPLSQFAHATRTLVRGTVRLREMETLLMETILIRASVSPRKMETLLLGSWWP